MFESDRKNEEVNVGRRVFLCSLGAAAGRCGAVVAAEAAGD